MTRRTYFNLCMMQSAEWLKSCAASPTAYMRPRHVALVRLALRRKT